MFRFSVVFQRLLQSRPTISLSSVRSKANVFVLTLKYGERGIWASCNRPWRPVPNLNTTFNQERSLHNEQEAAEREDWVSKMERLWANRNKHGEEIIFSPCDPPLGHVYLTSGNRFKTRRCRKACREAAQKLYAVHRHGSRKRPVAHISLFVPRDVSEKVKSEFQTEGAQIGEDLRRILDGDYPQMPRDDKNEPQTRICPALAC